MVISILVPASNWRATSKRASLTSSRSIAFDASYTHMYAPGTRRHIKGALKAGAMVEEIMEVLKFCVVQGVQACNLGIPILAEELERSGPANTGTSVGRK